MSVWLTQEEKDIWKQLARLNNMNLSAYTHFVIKEVIKESLNLPELKVSLDVDRESCEEDKFPIKLRMTKSELEAIRKLAAVRGQTRQALIVSAVRELLLDKSQIDPKQYQLISDSTLSLNRIGVNLNQIARVLNEQNKSGELNPSDLSITGKQIDVIADRAHLLKESQYRPHEWNAWPDVIPPRLDTEPAINGETRECDYWLVKLKNGSYRTGKITKDKYWVRFENQIAAYREFSPRPAEAVLENQTEFDPGGWNAYPKFNPDSEEVYEVMLKGGLQRSAGWKKGNWTFYSEEITAFKKIND